MDLAEAKNDRCLMQSLPKVDLQAINQGYDLFCCRDLEWTEECFIYCCKWFDPRSHVLRVVPSFVTAYTFCASGDTWVSYGIPANFF